jgi:hypothetical protein
MIKYVDCYKNTKPAYLWVFARHPYTIHYPGVQGDLFFSSPEKFRELLGRDLQPAAVDEEVLVKVTVPLDFDNWDYIPENY